MKVELPTQYNVEYPRKNLKYYSGYSKPQIAEKLIKASQGYCMYCGKKVEIEGDKYYHLEHSVDKDGNGHQEKDFSGALKHCKFNLAIACPECNDVCKKKVDKVDFGKYTILYKCPSTCDEMCENYIQIRNDYMKRNSIILQPQGKNTPAPHLISYNLLKHIYEPNCSGKHEDVLFFVQNHIDRFELNGRRYSPCIIKICAKIVMEYENGIKCFDGIMEVLDEEKNDYDNILGIKFVEFLKNYFVLRKEKQLIDFCKLLVVLDAVP